MNLDAQLILFILVILDVASNIIRAIISVLEYWRNGKTCHTLGKRIGKN